MGLVAMGACYATDRSDEAAGPTLRPLPSNREEGSILVSDEIHRIMWALREIEQEMRRCHVRPNLATRLEEIIMRLGDLGTAIELFESNSD